MCHVIDTLVFSLSGGSVVFASHEVLFFSFFLHFLKSMHVFFLKEERNRDYLINEIIL